MKSVALVGFSEKTLPFLAESKADEIWTLNHAYLCVGGKIPRIDRLFEIHKKNWFLRKEIPKSKAYWEWLQEPHEFPVYMQHVYKAVPASVKYPLEEVVADLFPNLKRKVGDQYLVEPYFTSTAAFMLALAIHELSGVEGAQIELYGIDMESDTEYCLGPEMRVLTSDLRWLSAKDLREGDEIVAFDEYPSDDNAGTLEFPRRLWRKATVEAIGRVSRPSVRILMEDGSVLICSKDHRWLTGNEYGHEFREAGKLTPQFDREQRGGRGTKLFKAIDVWESSSDYGTGYVAGILDGEGHLTQIARNDGGRFQNVLGFAQKDNELLSFASSTLEKHGFQLSDYSKEEDSVRKMEIRGGIKEIVRCLGIFRPGRLMAKFDPGKLGGFNVGSTPRVLRIEDIGWQEVVSLKTSTGTCVVEGFASHNSYQKPGGEFMIGIAIGRGIRVIRPEPSELCRSPMYGYDVVPYLDRNRLAEIHDLYREEKEKWDEKVRVAVASFDPLDGDKKQAFFDTTAWSYVYQGAMLVCEKLMLESDYYISRHVIEIKRTSYVNNAEYFKGLCNQTRAEFDINYKKGEGDPSVYAPLWDKYMKYRAEMFGNAGAVQVINRLMRLIDFMPVNYELEMPIREGKNEDK